MDLGLQGKKALVTGGSRGIGRAIAEGLAGEGADIAICARNEGPLQEVVAELGGRGVTAIGSAVDVADGAALKAWIESAASDLGGLDVVVANVSALGAAASEEAWRQSFEIDLLGTVRTVEAALPFLKRSENAAIVAISSIAGIEFFGGVRAYNALKAGLINYASSLASALAESGIRVNTVSPGTIFFEGGVWHRRQLEEPETHAAALAMNPMGRMGSAQEVANAAVFLSSPAASFISGTNLLVDGALTRGVQF
jgi:3-oxoacyl-[acyl-carrier protein] reductase